MKCRLQCLLFALMLGRAFSMIMVTTGGVHDKYSVEMETGIGAGGGGGGGGSVGTAANAGAVTAKTGTSSSSGGGSVGTAANAGTATASTAAGAPDITDLNSILESLLTSAGSSAAAAGSASATTSVTSNPSNPSNPQSPTTSSLFNKFGEAPNTQNPTVFTSSLFDKFGGAGGGGWPIFQLFQPNPPPKMVRTVYNTNNNARFSHGLPQFYPYVYKQYYDPYPGHYVLPLF